MYFNYWTDKISFKERISKDLMPLLQAFIDKPFVSGGIAQIAGLTTTDSIKQVVADWLDTISDVVFSCEIKIDVEKRTTEGDNKTIDVVKFIHVIPLDQ